MRVRSLGRHTTVGEMGLITGRSGSAIVKAEIASVAYELRAEAFMRLKTERPPLARALFTFVISVMAERLSFASKVIGVRRVNPEIVNQAIDRSGVLQDVPSIRRTSAIR